MGLTYNETKYVFLCNSYPLKYRSLEDHVYFTLRDIFMNAASADDAIECNQFNIQLTNEICYEDRTDTFTYTDILQDKAFVDQMSKRQGLSGGRHDDSPQSPRPLTVNPLKKLKNLL